MNELQSIKTIGSLQQAQIHLDRPGLQLTVAPKAHVQRYTVTSSE